MITLLLFTWFILGWLSCKGFDTGYENLYYEAYGQHYLDYLKKLGERPSETLLSYGVGIHTFVLFLLGPLILLLVYMTDKTEFKHWTLTYKYRNK